MNVIEIKDLSHPDVAVYSRLTEAQLRNKLEPEKGVFIAESLKVVRVALQQGLVPLSFLAERKLVESQVAPLTAERYDDVPVYTADREVIAQLTGYELSRGFLCAMQRPLLPDVATICAGKRRVAVVDGVVNSTNTGAIFRAATALGIEALLLTSTCCDPLNRRAVRVSMGTVFQLPWTWIGPSATLCKEPCVEAIGELKSLGFKTVALALSDNALTIDNPRLKEEAHLAIVMGTEGDGLGKATIAASDYVAKIPMQRGVDSLNVAAAAAVAFWELR
ncbi:MAG: RNA methyltransferase [Bacteroidales bacterium]|nr:RNA methyltransferase [Bacteroidales bacterium]